MPAATETSGGTGLEPTREYVWPEPEPGRQPTFAEPEAPAPDAVSVLSLEPVEVEPEFVHREGNRIAGLAIALLATAVFAALDLVALTAVRILGSGVAGDPFAVALAEAPTLLFLAPVAAFFIGLALIVLAVNRAGWWAYVLGGFFVAVVTAAAALAGGLIDRNIVAAEDRALLLGYLRDPVVLAAVLAAGVLGREVSVWGGALIAARARGVKRRNAEREAAAQP